MSQFLWVRCLAQLSSLFRAHKTTIMGLAGLFLIGDSEQ